MCVAVAFNEELQSHNSWKKTSMHWIKNLQTHSTAPLHLLRGRGISVSPGQWIFAKHSCLQKMTFAWHLTFSWNPCRNELDTVVINPTQWIGKQNGWIACYVCSHPHNMIWQHENLANSIVWCIQPFPSQWRTERWHRFADTPYLKGVSVGKDATQSSSIRMVTVLTMMLIMISNFHVEFTKQGQHTKCNWCGPCFTDGPVFPRQYLHWCTLCEYHSASEDNAQQSRACPGGNSWSVVASIISYAFLSHVASKCLQVYPLLSHASPTLLCGARTHHDKQNTLRSTAHNQGNQKAPRPRRSVQHTV